MPVRLVRRVGLMGLLAALLVALPGAARAALPPHLGCGFNVAFPDSARVAAIGFNWIKTFGGAPCPGRSPNNVLVRIEVHGTTSLADLRDEVRALAQSQASCLEAIEIGNEPNLDAGYGWATAPNAAAYTAALCAAHQEIKAISSGIVVVSAGLAPAGRVNGNWNGHPGHNGFFQDEREFAKEMFEAGAGNVLTRSAITLMASAPITMSRPT